ncbi:MAG TPA: hypothetical protein VMW64_01625 [Dehalococcoidia bacterium]|nr:hypothetical protein [Dehalococcoidia bacterium]
MQQQNALSELEFHLLSSMVDDREPLYVLYSDMVRWGVRGADLESVLQALVKLVKLGFAKCLFDYGEGGKRKECNSLSIQDLQKHCSGRTEEELREYPLDSGEYEFEPTPEGRKEEAKEIYQKYHLNL